MEEKDYFYEDDNDLDFMDLMYTLLKRWKLILIVSIPIFMLGIFFAFTRPDIYKAEMKLIVSSERGFNINSVDGGELTANQKLATTYSEIAKSNTILKNVIKKYDLDVSLKQLQNSVTISPVEDTELLQLTYQNSDPALAAAIINEIGNEFILKVRSVMNFQNIKIVEVAEIPREALPKKRSIIIIVSFISSIFIGCSVAFIFDLFFSKLKKTKDVEKILKASILGAIPDFNLSLNEKGEIEIEQTNEALRVIRTNLHFLNRKNKGRIFLIASSVPKEGKTTVASNYAKSIAVTGKKVLLIDCDIRRPRAHESFGISFDKGLESFLSGEKMIEEIVLKNIENNLDIIPTRNLTNNITELFLGDRIKVLLESLKDNYNTIVIDTPPLIVASDAAILSEYCDGIIYVIGYDQVSKKELEFGKSILDNANANIYGFIVNRINKHGFLYGNYRYYNYNYSYYKDYYN